VARNQGTRTSPGVGSRPSISLRFLGDIVSELRKVTWPTRQETTRLTLLVLAISVFIGAVLGVIDIGFAKLFAVLAGT